jgi:hypothetical protein
MRAAFHITMDVRDMRTLRMRRFVRVKLSKFAGCSNDRIYITGEDRAQITISDTRTSRTTSYGKPKMRSKRPSYENASAFGL